MNHGHDDGIIMIGEPTEEEHAEMLATAAAEMAYWRAAPAQFFNAWREGAALAGAIYFGDGTEANLKNATNRDQLAPNLERCKKGIGCLSSGEKVFLAALYTFYNGAAGQPLMQAANVKGMSDIASSLDLKRRRIVAELLMSYNGW